MNSETNVSRGNEDLGEILLGLEALAEQQRLQLEVFTEMATLLSHLTMTQREQRIQLEARNRG